MIFVLLAGLSDPEESDQNLVRRVLRSDPLAFRGIFERYHEPIFRFLIYKVGDRNLAEDLLQDVFVRTWENRHRLDPSKSLKSFLYTIANNLSASHFRHQKVVLTYENAIAPDESPPTPDSLMRDKERRALLLTAIAGLPEKTRVVFMMSRVEDLSYREISERLSISPKTVESHMGRALRLLRDRLDPKDVE